MNMETIPEKTDPTWPFGVLAKHLRPKPPKPPKNPMPDAPPAPY